MSSIQPTYCRWAWGSIIYDPAMLIWIDETGCDRRNTVRKFGYSIRGMPICDKRIIARGVRYSAIPTMSLSGIHDVYITEGTVNGDEFADFIEHCLLPIHYKTCPCYFMTFNYE